MTRSKFLKLIAAAGLGLAMGTSAFADDYPTRTIRIIAPYPPGGTTDIVARLVANGLSKQTGWTVVVENKAGAGGIVGHDYAAKAAPDGYTIVLGNSAMLAVSVSLFPKLELPGVVRVSLGLENTSEDIDALATALGNISSGAKIAGRTGSFKKRMREFVTAAARRVYG